jgi:hypothetical protein
MKTEEQARVALIEWAKEFYFTDRVEVKSLTYDKDEMNWTALLIAGPAQVTDTVTFLMDDVYGLHLQTIGGEEAKKAIERQRRAWEADMRDMQKIRDEWREYRNQ